MTLIQEALKTYVERNVPSAGSGYPILVPIDKTLPAWAYQWINPSSELLFQSGASGFVKDTVQLTVHGEEAGGKSAYQVAVTNAEAIRAALDGFQGTMSGVAVQYCHVRSIEDSWAAQHEMPVARLRININYRR